MKLPIFLLSLLSVHSTTWAQSHLLHYNTPAQHFEEALPIGNGSFGAMIYGDPAEDRISLNDLTLWTGEPDTALYTSDAYLHISAIREALFREDYKTAEQLQLKVQGHYSQNYQPLGTLTMSNTAATPVVSTSYLRTLNIAEAVASVNDGSLRKEYFASAPDSLIVIRLSAPAGQKFSQRFRFHCQLPNQQKALVSKQEAQLIVDGYAAYTSKPNYTHSNEGFQYDSKRGIHFRTIVRILHTDGSVTAPNHDELLLNDCTEAVVLIANVTSFNGNDKDPVRQGRDYKTLVQARIDHAATQSFDQLLSRHKADYSQLYNRVSIDLGETDPAIAAKPTNQQLMDYTDHQEQNPDLEELYFNYGRYLLISCSRTEGVPANLQGLWNESILPPWSCNYTSNINVQENYWPAEVANLSEMHQPLLAFIQQLPFTGSETAKAYYGVNEGWCLAHNTDIWGMTCPVGEHEGSPSWANWNMGGAWISTHLWEHYTFTLDKDYLSSIYPTLKGAADFCMGWLIEKDGYLLTAPSTSPENNFKLPDGTIGNTLYGGFADIAMIKECLTDTRQAAVILGESKAYIQTLTQTLQRLLPYRIGKAGNLQEWYHDWEDQDPQHRHQSHLFGLYPGHHITVAQTPALAKACKRTLQIKGDKTTGWSTGWRVNLQARLHESEEAYHIYRTLLKYVPPTGGRTGGTYPNLFDAHPPFQIDGNFGGCAGVMEMLVQSSLEVNPATGTQKATVQLLPALPKAWSQHGSVQGLCIRGGYTIDFTWDNGKITSYQLHKRNPSSANVKVKVIQ